MPTKTPKVTKEILALMDITHGHGIAVFGEPFVYIEYVSADRGSFRHSSARWRLRSRAAIIHEEIVSRPRDQKTQKFEAIKEVARTRIGLTKDVTAWEYSPLGTYHPVGTMAKVAAHYVAYADNIENAYSAAQAARLYESSQVHITPMYGDRAFTVTIGKISQTGTVSYYVDYQSVRKGFHGAQSNQDRVAFNFAELRAELAMAWLAQRQQYERVFAAIDDMVGDGGIRLHTPATLEECLRCGRFVSPREIHHVNPNDQKVAFCERCVVEMHNIEEHHEKMRNQ